MAYSIMKPVHDALHLIHIAAATCYAVETEILAYALHALIRCLGISECLTVRITARAVWVAVAQDVQVIALLTQFWQQGAVANGIAYIVKVVVGYHMTVPALLFVNSHRQIAQGYRSVSCHGESTGKVVRQVIQGAHKLTKRPFISLFHPLHYLAIQCLTIAVAPQRHGRQEITVVAIYHTAFRVTLLQQRTSRCVAQPR